MKDIEKILLTISQANRIEKQELVQSLWSGYGYILRYYLSGGKYPSLIVKHIKTPSLEKDREGKLSKRSHDRKIKSYEVESNWYAHYAHLVNPSCKLPELFHSEVNGNERWLIMEDLNATGYSMRYTPETVHIKAIKSCLQWLAQFHGQFLMTEPKGLWSSGTYWHLATRPEELNKMSNLTLKRSAALIDKKLESATYQTLIHGDAKLANFCFGAEDEVAAVDFQYVGKGCAMKDVAYLLSSCLGAKECEMYEQELLTFYFDQLKKSIDNSIDFQALKQEWQSLYKYAWADFYRFLNGWKPEHWKMHNYSERLTSEVLKEIHATTN